MGFLIAAGLAVVALGDGLILTDTYNELHVDPIDFFARMRFAWDPQQFLGLHTGWMHGYEFPYGWSYAALAAARVPPFYAQRIVDGCLFFTIASAAYWGLRQLDPQLRPGPRFAAASFYLFNVYVAFNVSNGYTAFLAPYAALPIVLGIEAAVLRGRLDTTLASVVMGATVLVAGGVNPPLIAILFGVAVLYLVVAVVAARDRRPMIGRVARLAVGSVVWVGAFNAYWIWPFFDYQRTFWLGSQLDESPLMHAADSSIANTVRGLGEWALFRSDETGPFFIWAAQLRDSIWSTALWLPPLGAFAAAAFVRRRTTATAFFALLIAVAIPLAVGLHRDPNVPAPTSTLYATLLAYVPGFAIFRSAYKWVWPMQLAIAGLLAVGLDALPGMRLRRIGSAVACIVVLFAFYPIFRTRENPAALPMPAWYERADRIAAGAPMHRVAVTPGQYVPSYDWASRMYYFENSLVRRDLAAGYISGAPSEGSHIALTRAFAALRSGAPDARALFRQLSVDMFLQRDDFRSITDFARLDDGVRTPSTVAHDAISNTIGAREGAIDGSLRTYALSNALPEIYGVANARIGRESIVATAADGDATTAARGDVGIDPETLDASSLRTALRAGITAAPSLEAARDLAVTSLSTDSATAEVFSAGGPIAIRSDDTYAIFVERIGAYPASIGEAYLPAPASIVSNYRSGLAVDLDGRRYPFAPEPGRAWAYAGSARLTPGRHAVRIRRTATRPLYIVAFVSEDRLARRARAFEREIATRASVRTVERIDAPAAVVTLPAGTYRLAATQRTRGEADAPGIRVALDRATTGGAFDVRDARRGAERVQLPFVPDAGVVTSAPALLPARWYLASETYGWTRGGPGVWFALARRAHFLVQLPARRATRCRLALRVAAIERHARIRVEVDGVSQGSFRVDGLGDVGHDTDDRVPANTYFPIDVGVDLRLHPGWNDVVLENDGRSLPAASLVPTTISDDRVTAAIGSDLAFSAPASSLTGASPSLGARIVARGGANQQYVAVRFDRTTRATSSFVAVRLQLPTASLRGAPHIVGQIDAANAYATEWIAAAYAPLPGETTALYRTQQVIGPAGRFDFSLADALPNSSTDRTRRVIAAWIVLGLTSARSASIGEAVDFEITNLRYALSARAEGVRTLRLPDGHIVESFAPGRLAHDHFVALPPIAARAGAVLDVRIAANRIEPSVTAESYHDGSWRPLGRSRRLQGAVRRHVSGLAVVRYPLPEEMQPLSADLFDGSVTVQGARRQLVFEHGGPVTRADSFGIGERSDDDHVTSIDVGFSDASRIRNPVEMFVPEPSFVEANYVLRLLAPLEPSTTSRPMRLRLRFPSEQDVSSVRALDVTSAVVVVPKPPGSTAALSVDGRIVSPGRPIALRAGRHLFETPATQTDIGALSIASDQAPAARRVRLDATTRSPIAIGVKIPQREAAFVLVLSQSYHPAWEATLDGRRLSHFEVNGFANGWLVPNGGANRTVELNFTAQAAYDTSLLILVAAIIVGTIVIVGRVRPQSRRER